MKNSFILRKILIIFVCLYSSSAFSSTVIKNVKLINNSSDKIVIELSFNNIKNVKPVIEYVRNNIQLSFKNVNAYPPQIVPVSDLDLKKIFTYQYNTSESRVRLIMNESTDALIWKNKISTKIINNSLRVELVRNVIQKDEVSKNNAAAVKLDKENNSINNEKNNKNEKKNNNENLEKVELKDKKIDDQAKTKSVEKKVENDSQNKKLDVEENEQTILEEVLVKKDTPNIKEGDSKSQALAQASSKEQVKNLGDTKPAKDEFLESISDDTSKKKQSNSFTKMIFSLVIVIGLMMTLLFGFKKIMSKGKFPFSKFGKNGKVIDVISSHYIAPKKSISLVKILDEYMVIGISSENINLLANLGKNVNFDKEIDDKVFGGSFDKELSKNISKLNVNTSSLLSKFTNKIINKKDSSSEKINNYKEEEPNLDNLSSFDEALLNATLGNKDKVFLSPKVSNDSKNNNTLTNNEKNRSTSFRNSIKNKIENFKPLT